MSGILYKSLKLQILISRPLWGDQEIKDLTTFHQGQTRVSLTPDSMLCNTTESGLHGDSTVRHFGPGQQGLFQNHVCVHCDYYLTTSRQHSKTGSNRNIRLATLVQEKLPDLLLPTVLTTRSEDREVAQHWKSFGSRGRTKFRMYAARSPTVENTSKCYSLYMKKT